MEPRNISFSDDLSISSLPCAIPPGSQTGKGYAAHAFTEASPNNNKCKQKFVKSSKRINDSYMSRDSHSEDVNENCVKAVNSEKKKSAAKHIGEKEFLSSKSAESKNISILKENPFHFFNKGNRKKVKDNSLIRGSNISRRGSKKKGRETVEIEVFMPIIDEKNNKIFYPKSTKPVVKRHFVTGVCVPKTKENILQNMYFGKNIIENTTKKHQSPVKKYKPESLCENALKPQANSNGTIKNAFAKRKSSAKDKGLEKGKTNAEYKNSSKEISLISENVEVSITSGVTKDSNADNAHIDNDYKPKTPVKCLQRKNKKCASKEDFENSNQPINPNVLKLSIEKACSATVANSLLLAKSVNITENRRVLNKNTSNAVRSKKGFSECDIQSRVISQKNTELKRALRKQVKSEEIDFERDESTTGIRKKKNENGWRRFLRNYSELKGNQSKNKWRKELLNNDAINVEDWIERCKYIQARDEYLEVRKGSYWRSS